MSEFLQSIPGEGVLLVIAVVLFMGFCALLYKGWDKYYDERRMKQMEMETEFDYNAVDDLNRKVFGDLF